MSIDLKLRLTRFAKPPKGLVKSQLINKISADMDEIQELSKI